METKGSRMAAAGAGVLVAIGVGVAHQFHAFGEAAGPMVDDAGRMAGKVVVGREVPAAASAGASTFRQMRNGTAEEKVVARAACAVMSSSAKDTIQEDEYETAIREGLPPMAGSPFAKVGDRYVARAATAMTIAHQNGGLGNWFVRYCLLKI
jgi:hypothetical protein